MSDGWFTPLAEDTILPLSPSPGIESLDDPGELPPAPPVTPGIVTASADPWNPGASSRAPAAALAAAARLALGVNLTQTPEYLAANLPPYNS